MIPVSEPGDINSILRHLSAEHPNASHIAFAFRIKTTSGIVSRFFDAGEPAGTAGRPIYQHLEGKSIINCMLAVIRYFGGIKLGAGGLARAYGNTARLAIESNQLIPFVEYCKIRVAMEYSQLQQLEYWLKKRNATIGSRTYTESIELVISLPADDADELKRLVAKHDT
jgi:uncharacterized YigZ family protein